MIGEQASQPNAKAVFEAVSQIRVSALFELLEHNVRLDMGDAREADIHSRMRMDAHSLRTLVMRRTAQMAMGESS